MSLTRSMGKQLNLQATLLHGEVQLVELALRTAAGNSGILNISHRVPFDDLAKRMPGAVLAFVPQTPMEQLMYNEYVRYFGAKARAGVANLDNNDQSLYLVPPVGEAQSLLAALEAAGVPGPLPRNCLLGVITAKPTAAMNTTVGGPAPAAAVPALAVPAAPAAPDAAVPAEAPADAPGAPADSEGSEKAAADEEAKEANGDDGEEDGEEGGGLSGEALANLFSNPELLQALQGMDEPGDD